MDFTTVEQIMAFLEKFHEKVQKCRNCKYFNTLGCAINIDDESKKPTENDYCIFLNALKNECKLNEKG